MSEPVSSIRNLGLASDAAFARAGINSAEEVRELGADRAYAMLLASGTRPHFIGYYALVMGLQGRPWNDAQGKENERLRKKFDDLKADRRTKAPPDSLPDDLAAALDRLGVRAPKKLERPR